MLYALWGLPLIQKHNRVLERKLHDMIRGQRAARLDVEDAVWLMERFDAACLDFNLNALEKGALWCSIFVCGRTFD